MIGFQEHKRDRWVESVSYQVMFQCMICVIILYIFLNLKATDVYTIKINFN